MNVYNNSQIDTHISLLLTYTVLCCDIHKDLVLKLVVSSHQAASTSWLIMPIVGVDICIVVVICQLHVQ